MKLCGLDSYDAFYQYSINNIPRFTSQVLDFLNIQFDKAYSQILDCPPDSLGRIGALAEA